MGVKEKCCDLLLDQLVLGLRQVPQALTHVGDEGFTDRGCPVLCRYSLCSRSPTTHCSPVSLICLAACILWNWKWRWKWVDLGWQPLVPSYWRGWSHPQRVSCKFGTKEGANIERVSVMWPSEKKPCLARVGDPWLKDGWLSVGFVRKRGLSKAAFRWRISSSRKLHFAMTYFCRSVSVTVTCSDFLCSFPYQDGCASTIQLQGKLLQCTQVSLLCPAHHPHAPQNCVVFTLPHLSHLSLPSSGFANSNLSAGPLRTFKSLHGLETQQFEKLVQDLHGFENQKLGEFI